MQLKTVDATVLNGQSKSDVIDLGPGFFAIRLIAPASLEGDTVGFEVSSDKKTFRTMKHEGVEYTFDVASDDDSGLDPGKWAGVRWLKLKTMTGSNPQNQTGDAAFQIIARGY